MTPLRRTYRPATARAQPSRATPAEAVVDAAASAKSERQAVFFILSVLQARLTDPEDIHRVLQSRPTVHRRRLLLETLAEFTQGITTIGERDFARLCREYGIPQPDRQVRRKDGLGRSRYLDVYFETARIVVEVDGLGHLDLDVWMDDQIRQNDIVLDGDRVFLRTSTVALRHEPEVFMTQLLRALAVHGN